MVNIGKGEQFTPKFMAISSNHRMPAIVDHALTTRISTSEILRRAGDASIRNSYSSTAPARHYLLPLCRRTFSAFQASMGWAAMCSPSVGRRRPPMARTFVGFDDSYRVPVPVAADRLLPVHRRRCPAWTAVGCGAAFGDGDLHMQSCTQAKWVFG